MEGDFDSNNKEGLIRKIQTLYEEKLQLLQNRMAETRSALESESKGSAGDKHETGRAMIQLEQEKLGTQIVQLEKDLSHFQRLDKKGPYKEVRSGALIETSGILVFIGPGLGPIEWNDKKIACISLAAPLAKVLLGKKPGDKAYFNGKEIEILSII